MRRLTLKIKYELFIKNPFLFELITLNGCSLYTEPTMDTFGKKLKEHRSSKGLSVLQLSFSARIPEANIRMIESDKRPASDAVLRQIASVPEMEISYGQLKAWKILPGLSREDASCLIQELEKMKKFLPE